MTTIKEGDQVATADGTVVHVRLIKHWHDGTYALCASPAAWETNFTQRWINVDKLTDPWAPAQKPIDAPISAKTDSQVTRDADAQHSVEDDEGAAWLAPYIP